MAKLKVKASTVDYGDISKRDKQLKNTNKLLWVVVILLSLNTVWDITSRQDSIKTSYNKVSEWVKGE